MCTSVGSADACGDPAEYTPKSLHPSDLRGHGHSARHLDLRSLPATDGSVVVRDAALFIGDGSERTPGEAVRLRNALTSLSARRPATQEGRVAVLQGGDRLLHRLWRRRGQLGPALAAAGYRVAIGPGFSTWADHTPWESLVAAAMSTSVAADLSRHLPTIPTLVWRNHEDLARLAGWVADNGSRQVALHPGALRGPSGVVLVGGGSRAASLVSSGRGSSLGRHGALHTRATQSGTRRLAGARHVRDAASVGARHPRQGLAARSHRRAGVARRIDDPAVRGQLRDVQRIRERRSRPPARWKVCSHRFIGVTVPTACPEQWARAVSERL